MYSTQYTVKYEFYECSCLKTSTVRGSMWAQDTVLLILSLVYGSFLTCIHWWVLCSRIIGCDLQVFSLQYSLLKGDCFGLLCLSPFSPHLGVTQALPQFPFLHCWPGNSAKAINRASVRAHLVCFLFQGLLFFVAWCASGLMFMYIIFDLGK